jgi:cytochrome P450
LTAPHPAPARSGPRRALEPARDPGAPWAWEVVGYDEARRALADSRLSKDPGSLWEAAAPGLPREPEGTQRFIRNLANTDPPGHTRLRRLLSSALTRRRVGLMRPVIEQAAGELADAIAPQAEVDLVRSFALPLQVRVTCDLLGVPPQHRASFAALAAAMLPAGESEQRPASLHAAYRRMTALIGGILAARREAGEASGSPDLQPDLLGALLAARDGAERLSGQEALSMAMLLVTAGQEPTIDLIANGMLALLLHPEQLRLVRAYPHLRPRAVEELLRYSVPVLAAPRIVAGDVEIDGTTLRRGSVLAVMLGSAHRDSAQFPSPDALDVTRDANGHLAFGHGIHYCAGAPLARMQAAIAIGTLVERFPHLALARPPNELRWCPSRDARGLIELLVTPNP